VLKSQRKSCDSYINNKELNNETINEFKQFPGIGKGTIDKIKEILINGFLKEIENYNDNINDKDKSLEELESIVGVGRIKALEFYNMGIHNVKQLKKAIKNNKLKVNEKILLGIKYYGKFLDNIPRNEIDEINLLIEDIIYDINNNYNDTNKFIYEICGSYRREKPSSGDIDVLISKLDTPHENQSNYLEFIIKKLKEPHKFNNNKPLLIDDITDKNYETKYMGFAKYKQNPVRRIDIRFVSYDAYYSALLYFTGSAELNKKMRTIAKKLNLKLSEYGLFKEDGTKIKINSEEDFFQKLDLPFIEPKYR
jgi:DNA polymerase/3'-5' exonuclease PolX